MVYPVFVPNKIKEMAVSQKMGTINFVQKDVSFPNTPMAPMDPRTAPILANARFDRWSAVDHH